MFDTWTGTVSLKHPWTNWAGRDVRRNISLASSAADQIRKHSKVLKRWQDKVSSILARTTDVENLDDRAQWQTWWNGYTETYTPSYNPANPYIYPVKTLSTVYHEVRLRRMSCFPAGTLVMTITGRRPIETLQAGDRVLSENAQTGELVFKPVQARTLRPAAPLVKITSGSHAVSSTRGHPFWVNGQGWTMAKHLKVGDVLHGLDGALRIDAIEDGPPSEAYNLVVGDYGTYFVGEDSVLVHDNTPVSETAVLVPGLTTDAVTESTASSK